MSYKETDDLLEDEDESNEDDSDSEKESSPPSDDKSSKRIRDLQSKADAADARANRLQAIVDAALKGDDSEASKEKAGGSVSEQSTSLALDLLKEAVFQTSPALAEAGYVASDLSGNSAAEIRGTAATLVRHYEELKTRVEGAILAKHGLAPELSDTPPPQKVVDYSKMSKKDFDVLLARTLPGGAR